MRHAIRRCESPTPAMRAKLGLLLFLVLVATSCNPISSLRRLTIDSSGAQVNGGGGGTSTVSVSDDGNFVVFASTSNQLPGANGTPAAKDASDPSVSTDGSVVSFTSSDTSLGPVEENSRAAVFVAHRGVPGVKSVPYASNAGVNNTWVPTWGEDTQILNNSLPCGIGSARAFDGVSTGNHALSGDGRLVVFVGSWCRLGALGTSVCNGSYETQAVFVTDAETGTTIMLVDCQILALRGANGGSAGVNGVVRPAISADGAWVGVPLRDGVAMMAPNQSALGFLPIPNAGTNDTQSEMAVANGGRLISFSTTLGLDAADTNNHPDQYVAGSRVARASALPPPDSNGYIYSSTITADGKKAVFTSTASNLVADDTNNASDVFSTNISTSLIGDAGKTAVSEVAGLFPRLEAEARGACNQLEPSMANWDFIGSAVVRPGSPFVTRPAPGVGPNAGGGIEVVVPEGGVRMCGFSAIGPKGGC